MTMTARVKKEIEQVKNDKEAGIDLFDIGDNIHFTGYITGPPDTPYEGGKFAISIELPDKYPFKPPKMTFATKIWHPNISSQTGCICLDILKDAWSPALTIRTALLSIIALLQDPVPDDPQDAVVAKMYTKNRREFNDTARSWTKSYASGEVKPIAPKEDPKVNELVGLGFTKEKAIEALRKTNNDVERAADYLFSTM